MNQRDLRMPFLRDGSNSLLLRNLFCNILKLFQPHAKVFGQLGVCGFPTSLAINKFSIMTTTTTTATTTTTTNQGNDEATQHSKRVEQFEVCEWL